MSPCCYMIVLRSDLEEDRKIAITAEIRVSLSMVSECPKWLDLKQIPGAA